MRTRRGRGIATTQGGSRTLARSLVVALTLVAQPQTAELARAEDPPSYVLGWGSTGTGPEQFQRAFGIAVDLNGDVYVADRSEIGPSSVKKFTATGSSLGQLSTGAGSPATDVAIGRSGVIYTLGAVDSVVGVWTSSGVLIRQWGTRGTDVKNIYFPFGIAVDDSENVFITDFYSGTVSKFTSVGTFIRRWGHFTLADGIWIRDNLVYMVNDVERRVEIFDTNGTAVGTLVPQVAMNRPTDGVVDAAGNFILVDQEDHVVRKYTPNGTLLWTLGRLGIGPGEFTFPTGIAMDADGNIYITQVGDGCCGGVNRVSKFSTTPTEVEPRTWGQLKAHYR